MTRDTVIRAESLGKRYRLGQQAIHGTLGEGLSRLANRTARRLRRDGDDDSRRDYWALQDVTFELERGDVLGILGRNGAGKSTLLKVLSRITEPTTGSVRLQGRVGSLLEVGSGFHQELTGRENVYLNGAILGMSRAEIRRKFDEIVAFADVDGFIDTPVKRYSSGMHARLAFAVAAHLDTSILIVDEVLAVGDIAFQEKCLGKMRDAGQHGRTVLFVSHNVGAVRALCNRGMLLEHGRMMALGGTQEVVEEYLERYALPPSGGRIPRDAPRSFSTGEAWIDSVEIVDSIGEPISQVYLGQRFCVRVTFEVVSAIKAGVIELDLATMDGLVVTTSRSIEQGGRGQEFGVGWHTVELGLDVVLAPQRYSIVAGLHHSTGVTVDWVERTAEVTVLNLGEDGQESFAWAPKGYIRPNGTWRTLPAGGSVPADQSPVQASR